MKKGLLFIPLVIVLVTIAILDLSCSKEDDNTPPSAIFSILPDAGTPDTVFTFDASGCSDEQDQASTLQVRWDWNSDGIFDTDFSSSKVLFHQFAQPGTYQITLEVRDSKGLGISIMKSLTVSGSVPTVTTASITNVTENSATCGGNVIQVYGLPVFARGVCWSTSPHPTIEGNCTTDGSSEGEFVSNLTGLLRDTTYYVRAYATNSVGTAYGDELSFTTLNIWSCGDPITILHIAGDVAPVTKTVTYGTVGNIPGANSKCWLSSNLGSDHQATEPNDVSEASAGWYWQFNREQGFKHDGNTRTPNTTWIDYIVENSNWMASNDPCNLELGNGWHIPSQSEWINADMSGGWNDLNDTWDSGLKLHAAGDIYFTTGLLVNRGNIGAYWSNLQGESFSAWYLWITGSVCEAYGLDKEYGLTIRCIRDL